MASSCLRILLGWWVANGHPATAKTPAEIPDRSLRGLKLRSLQQAPRIVMENGKIADAESFESKWFMRPGTFRPGLAALRQSTDKAQNDGPTVDEAACAKTGEDCRSSGCCTEEGMRCFEKNEYFAGCRADCAPGEPDPGSTGKYAREPWSCRLTSPTCACDAKCEGGQLCPSFPEVHYIYLPESDEDMRRSFEMAEEFKAHTCGEEIILRIPGVNPTLWPEGEGRYDRVEWFGHMLPKVNATVESPWWEAHNLAYAELDEMGESTWMKMGLKHHAGCSLSHFVAWMGARQRGLRHAIVAESDSVPSYWWRVYVGDESEFDSAVLALLEEAPDGWDIIFLDKGKFGVTPGKQKRKSMTRNCWRTPYNIYDWTGEGVAGLTLYMVSSRFLDKVPQLIHDYGLDMVDAWVNIRCNPEETNGGQLQCYSVMASDRELLGEDGKPKESQDSPGGDAEEAEDLDTPARNLLDGVTRALEFLE